MTWSPATLSGLLRSPPLQSLYVERNQLGGQLPQSLCNTTLRYIDLKSNRLTGSLPACGEHGDQSEPPSSSVQLL